ncbi:hypothetical protein HK098_003410 [Nowakowskiella sp. JEL0407]|nr:hypothetical protein HK098_003410 [Nowakowskiella sp. JEL0407]
MVFLHVKRGDDSLFLHETTASLSVKTLYEDIILLNNGRLRLKRLIEACKDLIEFGPLKPDSEQGYSEEQLDEMVKNGGEKKTEKIRKQINGREVLINPDPTGRRCGEAMVEEMATVVQKTLDDAETCISQKNVKLNKPLRLPQLKDCFDNIRGAITIVYPMGLPEWETVREIIENNEDLSGSVASKEILKENETALWWAGKEFLPEKVLSDYIGKNEKTVIILKIAKKGQGPPVKEPPLTEEAQKQLMAYYYRKQEEHKKLEENKDDEYVNSAWANPKSLKAAFSGINGQGITWRP